MARTLICAALLSAVACAKPHDPSRDRTLAIALASEPTLLAPPLIAETQGFVVADQILERLAEPDSTLDVLGDRAYRPRLAEGWSWAPDSLSIAFRIAADARWHDGRPVTAHDVRFTFALYTDTALASPAAPLLANIDSVQARDERVAVFWFHDRRARQFFDATYHMRILPEHVLRDVSPASLRSSAFARAPTGSGPFRFARWVPGQLVELAANAEFRRGRARVDRVVFTIAPDPSVALARALSGNVDVDPDLRSSDVPVVARSSAISVVRWASLSSGLVMLDLRDPARPNHAHPVFGDRSVRRALTMAIDRRRITAAALGDGAEAARGPLPWALMRGAPATLLPFDTAAAAALLDSSGWRADHAGGVRHRGSTPFRFTLLVPSTGLAAQRVAVLMQDELRRHGAQMQIEIADDAALAARLTEHQFDAALIALDWDPNPLSARQVWGSNNGSDETSNFSRYRSDTFDAAMDAAASATDSMSAGLATSQAWQTLIRDAPAIWLYDLRRVGAVRGCVHPTGVRPDAWWASLSDWSVSSSCRDGSERPS
ncbi:MAG TPA: peptide ABC transporter substrate-binding protein [Gemmatimonadaceae bacterium]|nr:peptide ABC transporter substrate-binding protein [Gemmatimonadaceae bacterium]